MTATSALSFDNQISFGDLLTSISVLIAALTVYVSFAQARTQQLRTVGDTVRTAAADALAALERYALLPKALSEHAQSLVVSVSQDVANATTTSKVNEARDRLWQGLTEAWETTRSAQRAEGVEKAHVRLYGHRPDAYDGVAAAIRNLDDDALVGFNALLLSSQQVVASYQSQDRALVQPAQVGNDLRDCLQQYDRSLEQGAESALSAVRSRLQAIIAADDKQVTDREWHPAGT